MKIQVLQLMHRIALFLYISDTKEELELELEAINGELGRAYQVDIAGGD